MTKTYRRSLAAGGFLLLAVLLSCLSPAMAQQTLGAINGTVLDPSGAAVADATVTVTNAQIDLSRTVKAQASGFFQIFNLPIGTYQVSVSQEGFETTQENGIGVQEARTTTVNVALKVGKASVSVEVTATPLLNATDATNGYTLDSTQIETTPLATGSFTQLAVLSPGVNAELLSGVGTNAGIGNQPIWANGQRDTSNTFQVNGVDVTNLFNGKSSSSDTSQRYNFNIGSGASGGAGNVGGSAPTSTSVYGSNGNSLPSPPPDFLQELRVNASLYDAQQGATSGAQIDANTGTGTNKWHGSLYGTRATNAFNAAPFFFKQGYLLGQLPEALENPQLHRETMGGTVGGPLWKDKLYFFGAYQRLHTSDQTTGLSQMAVPYGLSDDRSNGGLLAALNSYFLASGKATVTSVTVDPVANAILSAKLPDGKYLIPSAQDTTEATVVAGQNNVTLRDTSLFTGDQATASLDYDLTKTDRLSAKYYYQHDPAFSPHVVSSTDGFPGQQDNGSHVFALGNTISLGSRINWEQRLGFVRMKSYSNFNQTVKAADPTFGMNYPGGTQMAGLLAQHFAKSNGSSLQVGPYSAFVNDGYFQNRVNPSTNVIFAAGKHTFVAGGGFSYTQLDIRNLRTGIGQTRVANFQTFLAGTVNKSQDLDSIGADGHNYANRYYRSNEWSGYLQDKYQLMPNLSITAGVRYDYHGGLTEKYGNIFNFEPSLYNVEGSTVTSGSSANGTTAGFKVNSSGFVVAHNNKYYPTASSSESTLTGRQWGISPRLGFAWAPRQSQGKVVFSGGVGLYYDRGELFSYLSEPAGGSIGGPFGVTEAPPLANYISGSGHRTLSNPLGSAKITTPNANPAFFTTLLQSTLDENVADCGAVYNQNDGSCDTPFYFGAYARKNKLPYTTNYTFKFQWQPVNDVAFTLGYSGNRGRHGVIPVPFNQAQIATPSNPINGEKASYGYQVLNVNSQNSDGSYNSIASEPWDTEDGGNVDFRSPYPGYSPNSALFEAAGVSAYDALESHLEKKFSHNISAGFSYTFSHTLDEQSDVGLFFTGNNPNNLHQSYATSDFDRTHVFSANFASALPNAARAKSALSYVTNDWKLTGIGILQSGEPYSLYEFYGAVGSIYYGNYPNLPNPVLPIKDPKHPRTALTGHNGSMRSGTDYIPAIDPSQIAINYLQPGQKGIPISGANEPSDIYENDFAPTNQRNIFRQSPQKRLDLSMRKAFHLTEKAMLQYEFNVFNVTNTTSLDVPQDQTAIGQAYACNAAANCGSINYGQVVAGPGAPATLQSNNPNDFPLYLLPQTTGTGSGTHVTNSSFGSVTNTIGGARAITMGIHITY